MMAYRDLVCVRIHADLGIHSHLQSRDPQEIARALCLASQSVYHSDPLQVPLWRSIDQLKVAVSLGVSYVSHDLKNFSSVSQALSIFECSVFLSRWLFSIASEGREAFLSCEYIIQQITWILC
jgi:hypothetical protein